MIPIPNERMLELVPAHPVDHFIFDTSCADGTSSRSVGTESRREARLDSRVTGELGQAILVVPEQLDGEGPAGEQQSRPGLSVSTLETVERSAR